MAEVYRNTKTKLLKKYKNDDYKQGFNDCEDALRCELRNHLTPLLNAVELLDMLIKDKGEFEALKKVLLKKTSIDLMREEIDNIANLRL